MTNNIGLQYAIWCKNQYLLALCRKVEQGVQISITDVLDSMEENSRLSSEAACTVMETLWALGLMRPHYDGSPLDLWDIIQAEPLTYVLNGVPDMN